MKDLRNKPLSDTVKSTGREFNRSEPDLGKDCPNANKSGNY